MKKHRIFLFLLLAFISGIAIASFFNISKITLYFIFLIAVLLLFLSKSFKYRLIAFLLLFFVLGVLRYQLSFPKISPDRIEFYNGKNIVFKGIVVKKSIGQKNTKLTIKTEKIENEKTVNGLVLLTVPKHLKYNYGDELKISCYLKKPPIYKKFNYRMYLAHYNIYSLCSKPKIKLINHNKGNRFYALIYKIRNKGKNLIYSYFKEPQASLISALTLGFKKEIPKEIKTWFNKTGTTHITAISGMHVVIIAFIIELFLFLIPGMSRANVFYPTSVLIILFCSLDRLFSFCSQSWNNGFNFALRTKNW